MLVFGRSYDVANGATNGINQTRSEHPPVELAALVLSLEVQGLFFALQHLFSQLDGPLGIRNNEKLVTKLCIQRVQSLIDSLCVQ